MTLTPLAPEQVSAVAELLRSRTGLAFGPSRQPDLEAAILKTMAHAHVADADALVGRLATDTKERLRPERPPGRHRADPVSGEGIIRVLIAERSAGERTRLTALLRSDPAIEIVGEATESAEVVERVKPLKPHVALVDIHLPPAGGFEAAKEIMIEAPTPIVVVSNDDDARQVEMSILALRAGALAVVPRPAATAHPGDAAMRPVPTVKAMAQVEVVRRWRDPSQRRALLPARMSPSRLPRGVIAQDEASSVVFGMPGAAVAAGVVDRVVPLGAVVRELLAMAEAGGNGA